ncbi:MAG: hypothetical protein IH940_13875 [Acidobacteria bacterium]|nr:hypothetical protein [Acidobacteriota bacterium]
MMKRSVLLALIPVFALIAVGCSDDDDSADSATTSVVTDGGDSSEETAPPPSSIDPEDLEVEVFGEGTATITLDNGEVFEEGVACTLEPQIAAGQEILFTATAFDGSIDVTQFGPDGPNPDLASVGIYETETFDAIWLADSRSAELTLTLDGSTISGIGHFQPGEDLGAGLVAGSIEVNC